MDISKIQGYLVGQVLASIAAILLLLLDDFAGFYYYDYYNKISTWGYIDFGSTFLASALILIGVLGLLFSLSSALKTLRAKEKLSAVLVEKNVKNSIRGGMFTAGLAGIGALVFVAAQVIEGTQEWWLGSGFYGAFIGGLVIVIFGKNIIDRIKS